MTTHSLSRRLIPVLLLSLVLVRCGDGDDPVLPSPEYPVVEPSLDVVGPAQTLIVNATDDEDDGVCDATHCSLREALNAANGTTEPDEIAFEIPGPGPYVITPATQLPIISRPVIIDGRTQSGYAGSPVVEINGREEAPDSYGQYQGIMLSATSSGSEVWALVIRGFGEVGLFVGSDDGSLVADSYIGTDVTGVVADGNGWSRGMFGAVVVAGTKNVLRGNVIAGNPTTSQVVLDRGAGHVVENNYIGLGADGSTVLGGFYPTSGEGWGVVVNNATQNRIEGNVVVGFPSEAIDLRYSLGPVPNNEVRNNYIGTDATGTVVAGNKGGVRVMTNSGANILEGNVVANSKSTGILIGGPANQVRNNIVGLDPTGTTAMPNQTGISVGEQENVVEGNRVSGNGSTGIVVVGQRNVVRSNVVGLDAAGTTAIPNRYGMSVGGNEQEVVDNVVAGNTEYGIRVVQATLTTVSGNRVGTNEAGTGVVGNQGEGILLYLDQDFLTLTDNIVVGSGADGIHLVPFADEEMTANTIKGNRIGELADGTAAGNAGHGIFFEGTRLPEGVVKNSTVDENVIAHNGGAGIYILRNGSDYNRIASNRIYDNGGLGIALGGLGVLANDAGDVDDGANDGQNYPVLTEVVTSGTSLRVVGTLDGMTNFGYVMQFFANASCDASGHGEGETYLGETEQLIHPAGEPLSFETSLDAAVTPGTFITATARNSNGSGSTSEFSACFQAVPGNSPPVADAAGPYEGNEGTPITFDGAGSSDPDGDALTYAWDFGDGHTDTGPTPSHTYPDNGTWTVTLTVTDPMGEENTATSQVTVNNVAPDVKAGPDVTVDLATPLEFVGSFADAGVDDGPWSWEIDWGDGTTSTGAAEDPSADVSGSHLYGARADYTVTLTVTDKDGGAGADTRVATVANREPVADAAGPYEGNEGSPITFDATGSSDPDGDALTYAWDFGDGTTDTGPTPSHTYADNGVWTVSLTVTDGFGGEATATSTATVDNVAPEVGPVTAPTDPIALGQPVPVSTVFSDAGVNDGDWAWEIDWGDGSAGSTGASATQGTIAESYVYPEPGVYRVTVTVTDKDGDASSSVSDMVAVYDPSGGFVTGAGWIESPAGALVADPSATGKALFGFVSRYARGATVPTGNTDFRFQAGDLHFTSSVYEFLVVTQGGQNSQFRGSGTINDELAPNGTEYRFMIWASDDNPDTFRIRIWWEEDATAEEFDVYDNGLEQAIGAGNIVIRTR